MMAKAIEAFSLRTAGGTVNFRFTGRVVRRRLFFRVAKRFFVLCETFFVHNFGLGTPKLSKRLSFPVMDIRAAADKMAAATDKLAAILDRACAS